MPRVVISRTIDIHYQSPHELVEHLTLALESRSLCLTAPDPPASGARREVIVHLPQLGRELRLMADVVRPEPSDPRGSIRLKFVVGHAGSDASLHDLGEILGRIRSGAILEDARVDGTPDLRIRAMSPALKTLLAVKATYEERKILARDAHPQILSFLLKNPALTLEEVRLIAARTTLHQGHFEAILGRPEWMCDEVLRGTLARNPRLPEYMAETVLHHQSTAFIKTLAEAVNTIASTARVARKLLGSRGIGAKVGRQKQ